MAQRLRVRRAERGRREGRSDVFILKKWLHGFAIGLGRRLTGLLPDKVPVTFVGVDASLELCDSIARMGAKKLLIVTDAMLVELGLVEPITAALQRAGLQVSVFDGVEPDPTSAQVDAGLAQFEREGADGILAVGGGSSIDAAKVIAAIATNGGSVAKVEGTMKVRNAPVPLYAIPTTAGTGSEVTLAAVVSDPVTHAKKFVIDPKLLPKMTALDPALMIGLPPAVTAATGMDALTHAIESYLSKTSRPQTEAYATAAVSMVFEHLPTAYTDGSNIAARKAMALASYYAGLAFTRTGVGYVHAVAHTFGAYYGTPHGLANAIALPHVLDFSKQPAQAQLARLADLIGIAGATESEKAERFIDAVRDLMTKVDIPATLGALKASDIPAIATQALDEAHLNYPVPRYMSAPQCEGLLRGILPAV
jgi:alcohol dehydrogenase